jgi:hypothetical protein
VSVSVLYMSMSLDGYIAGPNDKPGNPGGDGFDRLHEWITTPDGGLRPALRAGRGVVRRDEHVRRGAGGSAYRGADRSLGR